VVIVTKRKKGIFCNRIMVLKKGKGGKVGWLFPGAGKGGGGEGGGALRNTLSTTSLL